MKLISLAMAVIMCFLITRLKATKEEKKISREEAVGKNKEEIAEGQNEHAIFPGSSWLQDIQLGKQEHLSRKVRNLLRPAFIKGSHLEVKWSLNFPFETFVDYKTKLHVANIIKVPYPEYLTRAKRSADGSDEGPELEGQRDEIQEAIHPRFNASREELHKIRRAARQERAKIYKYLQGVVDRTGLSGHLCLLRAICEVAEAPLAHGVLGEIVNALLTATVAGRPEDPTEKADYDEYIEAEIHGRLNGDCDVRYDKCPLSLFELVPDSVTTSA